MKQKLPRWAAQIEGSIHDCLNRPISPNRFKINRLIYLKVLPLLINLANLSGLRILFLDRLKIRLELILICWLFIRHWVLLTR